MGTLSCFRANDIRGQLGRELNESIAYAIGRAFALEVQPQRIVVGGDIRLSSKMLKLAIARGLQDEGVDVIDIGMTGTEEVYFATKYLSACGGIEVTASHNPIDYNGMKLVREDSKPISAETGLKAIELFTKRIIDGELPLNDQVLGKYINKDLKLEYAEHIVNFINPEQLKPLKLVVNSGNGSAGPALDAIERQLILAGANIEFIKIHHTPDGNFPNGIPNPLLAECRSETARVVIEHNADMGIAWDGDFDRCFLFDEKGKFIEGYYIVGLLAETFLQQRVSKQSKEKVIHDTRLTWNTIDIVNSYNCISVMSKSGHATIKERMRKENAVYGGEMSAHHYFRDFAFCDSGMIPWLLIAELLSIKGTTLSSMVKQRIAAYPTSGEINIELTEPQSAINQVLLSFKKEAVVFDETDGISLEFDDCEGQWRFNLRCSNTEPLVRLNVESKADISLMKTKTNEILNILLN